MSALIGNFQGLEALFNQGPDWGTCLDLGAIQKGNKKGSCIKIQS